MKDKILSIFYPFVSIKNENITFNITKKHPENFKYAINLFRDLETVQRAVDPNIYTFNDNDYQNIEQITIEWHINKKEANIQVVMKSGEKVKGILTLVELQAMTMRTITCPTCGADLYPWDIKEPNPDYKCPKCGAVLYEFTEITFFKGNMLTTKRKEI